MKKSILRFLAATLVISTIALSPALTFAADNVDPYPDGQAEVTGYEHSNNTAQLIWEDSSFQQPLGTISDYNLFVFNNYSQLGADCEGPVFVKNKAEFIRNWSVGKPLPGIGYGYYKNLISHYGNFKNCYAPTLVVGESLNLKNFSTDGKIIVDNGDFLYGENLKINNQPVTSTLLNSNVGSWHYNNRAVTDANLSAFASSAKGAIEDQMNEYSGLSKKEFSASGNALRMTLSEQTKSDSSILPADNVHVVDLDASGFKGPISISNFDPVKDNLIINVTGGQETLFTNNIYINGESMGWETLRKYSSSILWNIPGKHSKIETNTSVCGSIVAPDSDILASAGNISGNVVVKNLTAPNNSGFECHSIFFKWKTIKENETTTTASESSESSTQSESSTTQSESIETSDVTTKYDPPPTTTTVSESTTTSESSTQSEWTTTQSESIETSDVTTKYDPPPITTTESLDTSESSTQYDSSGTESESIDTAESSTKYDNNSTSTGDDGPSMMILFVVLVLSGLCACIACNSKKLIHKIRR